MRRVGRLSPKQFRNLARRRVFALSSGGARSRGRTLGAMRTSRRCGAPWSRLKSIFQNTLPALVRHDQQGRVAGAFYLQTDFVRRTVCRTDNKSANKKGNKETMNMKTINMAAMALSALLCLTVSGAWAQDDEVALTPVSDGSWTLVMPSADVELEVEYYTDAELLEMGEAVELTKTADGVWTLAAMPECDIELIVEYEPPTAYETWAEDNGITGAWNEMSGGIYNVFRYVFGQPTGDFPLITGIDVGESKVVITTTPLAVANGDGVTVSVVESSDLAGKTVTDTQALEPEGRAEFTKDPAAEFRFYRLKADVTE
jgi:hypothetical protein